MNHHGEIKGFVLRPIWSVYWVASLLSALVYTLETTEDYFGLLEAYLTPGYSVQSGVWS